LIPFPSLTIPLTAPAVDEGEKSMSSGALFDDGSVPETPESGETIENRPADDQHAQSWSASEGDVQNADSTEPVPAAPASATGKPPEESPSGRWSGSSNVKQTAQERAKSSESSVALEGSDVPQEAQDETSPNSGGLFHGGTPRAQPEPSPGNRVQPPDAPPGQEIDGPNRESPASGAEQTALNDNGSAVEEDGEANGRDRENGPSGDAFFDGEGAEAQSEPSAVPPATPAEEGRRGAGGSDWYSAGSAGPPVPPEHAVPMPSQADEMAKPGDEAQMEDEEEEEEEEESRKEGAGPPDSGTVSAPRDSPNTLPDDEALPSSDALFDGGSAHEPARGGDTPDEKARGHYSSDAGDHSSDHSSDALFGGASEPDQQAEPPGDDTSGSPDPGSDHSSSIEF
jgi:hypothetical protein